MKSSKWLSTFLVFLAKVGVPATMIGVFNQFVVSHPKLSLGIILLYEVGVFTIGRVGKVWEGLETLWIERIATWIDIRVQWFFSNPKKQYCKFLFYQHRYPHVKSLKAQSPYYLELTQVFMEVNIIPTAADQASPNPVQDPVSAPRLRSEKEHTILHYLTDDFLTDQHLVILGPPGSGKTTLLQNLILVLVNRRHHHSKKRIPYKLPIFLTLHDHVTSLMNKPNFLLVNAIQDHLEKVGKIELLGWLEQRLLKGHCLILLDGLDEVTDLEDRKQIAAWVQQQMVTYHKNRFIITSRRFGYLSNPLSGVTVLAIQPFTPTQIKEFVHKWYFGNETLSTGKNDSGVSMLAKAEAEDLLGRMYDTPALLELAVNPLLRTMIVTIHRYQKSLPKNRLALYSAICEVFLSERQKASGAVTEFDTSKKHLVLQLLAYHMMMMRNNQQEIPLNEACKVIKHTLAQVNSQMQPEVFIQMIENTSGLLLAGENGVYCFAHLTFQEYFAATYIREKRLRSTLLKQLGNSRWNETIRLYCAQADASPVITACLNINPPSISTLILALHCRDEGREVKPEVNTLLDTLIDQGVEDTDTERQQVVAEALLARRKHQMIHLKEDIYRDTSFLTCAEYQLFLDYQQRYSAHCQPDHWENIRFLQGQGHSPILGVRRSDAIAFCSWLTNRDPGIWAYRLPNDGELEQAGNESMSRNPKGEIGYWVEGGKSFVWPRENRILSLSKNIVQQQFDCAFTYPFDLEIDDARALERARNRAMERICARAFDLDNTSDRAHTLDHIYDPDHFSNNPFTHLLDLVFAVDRTRAMDLAFNSSLALKLVQELDNSLTYANSVTRFLVRARDRDHVRDRIQALGLALKRIRAQLSNSTNFYTESYERRELTGILCQCVCLLTQEFTMSLLCRPKDEAIPQFLGIVPHHGDKKQENNIIQDIIDTCIDISVNFAILEKRIQGTFPVYEGIMIIKERNKKNY